MKNKNVLRQLHYPCSVTGNESKQWREKLPSLSCSLLYSEWKIIEQRLLGEDSKSTTYNTLIHTDIYDTMLCPQRERKRETEKESKGTYKWVKVTGQLSNVVPAMGRKVWSKPNIYRKTFNSIISCVGSAKLFFSFWCHQWAYNFTQEKPGRWFGNCSFSKSW